MAVIYISGIDTGIGKSVATGLLGRQLLLAGKNVITQKLVQTGCGKISGDILIHRLLMGMAWNRFDDGGITCPYTFPFPASPHLAAELAGEMIRPQVLAENTSRLARSHEVVLVEGAGGLMVPLTREMTLLDYLEQQRARLLLVSSSRLGSINHTLLSLSALAKRRLELLGLIYNIDHNTPPEITADSREIIASRLHILFPAAVILDMWKETDGSFRLAARELPLL